MAEAQSRELGVVGISAFYLGHILSDYSWFSLVSLAVASGRRMLTPGVYRGLIVVCGLFLWIMGGCSSPRGWEGCSSRLLKKGVSVKLPCRWSQEHDDVRL